MTEKKATTMPRQLPLVETHRNHYLFSDHYLNAILPRQAVWREAEAKAHQVLEAITAKYREVADALPHYNEAAAEQEWIRPVLDILGHVYHVQPALPGAAGRPDYAFFADETAKSAATPRLGTAAFWETALAVGDAKRWDRPLDRRFLDGAPDAFTNANPCYQIDYYLRRTSCAWGVVSNGRRWRLYHRDSSYRLDVFYEVDLAQLIEQGDVAAFHYFYLFFRAEAFRPDAEGHCWLDTVLAESAAYAVRVGDELTDRVYEALRLLAQGFLDYPGGVLDPATDLPHIHDACLILLYRLLFLFYAESRGLLPLENPSYGQQYSLKALKEDIAAKLDAGVVFLPRRATLWDDLKTLSGIIYEGSQALAVPAYNGGLFDPAKHPFLEEHAIGDRYLAQAIDLLARAEAGQKQGLSFVDYRDLSIRHMGSIYEGLLEYKLAYAAEEMAIVRRGKKKEDIVPSSEVDKVMERIPAEQVYLVTDRGERKATGSYYTPDYIVKYIVEQTLGPLADAQAEAVKKEIESLKARNRGAARRTKAYKDELARLQNSFANRIQALNILDPAMGSGHFLVEATDYLARRIVEAGVVSEALTDGSTAPVLSEAEGLTGTGNEESELSYWRRRVVERCIYGVDLNPLAVELAKLSLWLATVAKGKPLSFLDHHLRGGNSLIGARVADLQALPVRKKGRRKTFKVSQTLKVSQLAIWDESAFTQDMFRVVGAMQQIQEYESADLVSVQEKERIFAETVERERRKWRDIADLWTAAYFGLQLTPQLYNACLQHAQGKPVLLQAAQAEALLAQAHQIWEEKRFFHWEIEFPEIFFDQHGQHKGDAAGFDAVVGNPPYLSMENMAPIDRKFYYSKVSGIPLFYSAVHKSNVYALFWEKAIDLTRQGGFLSYIAPYSWLSNSSFLNLRKLFLGETALREIVLLPIGVFDAGIATCVAIAHRTQEDGDLRARDFRVLEVEVLSDKMSDFGEQVSIPLAIFRGAPDFIFNLEWTPKKAAIRRKIEGVSLTLSEICSLDRGADTADNVKYTGHEWRPDWNPKKLLIGETFDRYDFYWDGLYIYYLPEQMKREKPTARPGEAERFEVNEKIILYRFLNQKRGFVCVYDDEQFYSLGSTYVLSSREATSVSLKFVTSILNSRLVAFYNNELFAGVKITRTELLRIPIRRIEFITLPEKREELVEEALLRYEAYLEHGEDVSVRAFVWARLLTEDEPEQADVVHDILARLAERMIEMHKQKQAEVKGFLGWLADYTGRAVDNWALKTNLRRYYEHDWAEMQRILKRNQRKLPKVDLDVDAYRNEPAQKIGEAWETSMETLRPLLKDIAATDRLIDRIVYQLYGLTDEEIALVGGTESGPMKG